MCKNLEVEEGRGLIFGRIRYLIISASIKVSTFMGQLQ